MAQNDTQKSEVEVMVIEEKGAPLKRPSAQSASLTKTECREIEGIRVLGLSDDDFDFFNSFTPAMRRRLSRKLDLRLVPYIATMWFVSHMDRSNIANAKIEGMTTDLGLTGTEYNAALAIFFVPYILFEIPSNIVLKKLSRPSWYLGGLVVAFGATNIFHGLVNDFSGLVGCRFLLGVFEAGLFPASLYLLGFWYPPGEFAIRTGLFFSLTAMSAAFAGLIAAAISQMDGLGGYAGWRWIFIIEGLMTIVVGLISAVFMADMPSEKMRWLSKDELRYVEISHKIKQGGSMEGGNDIEGGVLGLKAWDEVKAVVGDWTMWSYATLNFVIATAFYGLKFALPTITRSMGFSRTHAQLLSAPPFLAGGIATIATGHISDRMKSRALWVEIAFVLMFLGHAVPLAIRGDYSGPRLGVVYAFIVFNAIGAHAGLPPLIAWMSNNTAPAGRRAVAMGFLVSVGNFGGILGSFMYLDSEKPAYPLGYGIGTSLSVVAFGGTIALWWALKRRNVASERCDQARVRDEIGDEVLLNMGNKSPLFRFVL